MRSLSAPLGLRSPPPAQNSTGSNTFSLTCHDRWEDVEVDVSLITVFTPPDCSTLPINSEIRTRILSMRRRNVYGAWKTGRKCLDNQGNKVGRLAKVAVSIPTSVLPINEIGFKFSQRWVCILLYIELAKLAIWHPGGTSVRTWPCTDANGPLQKQRRRRTQRTTAGAISITQGLSPNAQSRPQTASD